MQIAMVEMMDQSARSERYHYPGLLGSGMYA